MTCFTFRGPWLPTWRSSWSNSMNNQDKQCALGIHCHGEGKLQAHAVELNILVCVKCVAREEKLTMKQIREDIRNHAVDRIHAARTAAHICP